MGLTGLLLTGFLIVHMAGNLQLIFSDAVDFNAYSHTLVSNPLIYFAEIGLLALFVFHFGNGIYLTLKNKDARSKGRYAVDKPAGHTSRKSFSSGTMIISGALVLIFVPLHVWMFKYGDMGQLNGVNDVHGLVVQKFSNLGIVIWYCVSMILIGFHLWHGFGSGFESLGVRHRKGLRRFGQALAVVLTAGFFIIPIAVYLR